MSNGTVNFANAMTTKTVGHAWVNRNFVLIPGEGQELYHFQIRPEVKGGMIVYGKWTLTVNQALGCLVKKYGGIDAFVTEEMFQEATALRRASRDIAAAVSLVTSRCSVTEPSYGFLKLAFRGQAIGSTVMPRQLKSLTELPVVVALARIHGEQLGRDLLDAIRNPEPVP